eukprot:TRINITY_DN5851_c0_g3_i1.p1 TRINITY_DN5851_c0_g3~~TRINITY_DN5851_c0_g3_i1.p1  ORF type:complete len:1352 (+),score=342.25 TRINITY_DN5851_c0_g3_i1:75-4130(+)
MSQLSLDTTSKLFNRAAFKDDVSYIVAQGEKDGKDDIEILMTRIRGKLGYSDLKTPQNATTNNNNNPSTRATSPIQRNSVNISAFSKGNTEQNIQPEEMPTPNLIKILNARNKTLQMKVATELEKRVQAVKNPQNTNIPEKWKDVLTVLNKHEGMRTVFSLFPKKGSQEPPSSPPLLALILKILFVVLENNKEGLRKIDGVTTLVLLLQFLHPNFESYLTTTSKIELNPVVSELTLLALNCVKEIASAEKNVDQIKKAHGIPILLSLMSLSAAEIRNLSSEILIEISQAPPNPVKNQEAIIDAGVLSVILKILTENSMSMPHSVLKLLQIIVTCAKARAIITKEEVLGFFSLLQPSLVYTPEREHYQSRVKNAELTTTPQMRAHIELFDVFSTLCIHEHSRNWLGKEGVQRIIAYLTPPSSVPFDAFHWSPVLLEHLLKFTLSLISDIADQMQSNPNRELFMNAGGGKIMCTMLVRGDVFPSTVLLCAAEVIAQLSKVFRSGSKSTTAVNNSANNDPQKKSLSVLSEMGKQALPSLLHLFNTYPTHTRVRYLLIQTIKNLALDPATVAIVFQERGMHFLHERLLFVVNKRDENVEKDTNDVVGEELLTDILECYAVLSADKFMRRVIRLQGTVGLLIPFLERSQKEINQRWAAEALFFISTEKEGAVSILDGLEVKGVPMKCLEAPSLVTVLYNPIKEAILCTLKLTITMCKERPPFLDSVIENGLPEPLLNSLLHRDAEVQKEAIELLIIALANVPTSLESFLNAKLKERVDELKNHENVKLKGSKIANRANDLSLVVKKLLEPPPPPPVVDVSQLPPPILDNPPLNNVNSNNFNSNVAPKISNSFRFEAYVEGQPEECYLNFELPKPVTYENFADRIRRRFQSFRLLAPGDIPLKIYLESKKGFINVPTDHELSMIMEKLAPVLPVVRFLVESLVPLPNFQEVHNSSRQVTSPRALSPRDEIKLINIEDDIFRKVNGFSEQRLRELVYELLPRTRPGLLFRDLINCVEMQVPFTQWGTVSQRAPILNTTNVTTPPMPPLPPTSLPPPPPPPPPNLAALLNKPLQIKKKTTTENKAPSTPTNTNNANFMQELQSAVRNNKLTPSTERKENDKILNNDDKNPPSFVDELKNVMHTGTLRLKKINTQEEIEKRRREKQESKALDLLREISEVGQQRQKGAGMNQVTLRRRGKTFVTEKRNTVAKNNDSPLAPKIKKTLVDTSALLGMQVYQRDIGQWVLDVQTILASQKQMVYLVFHLLEMREFEMAFADALSMISADAPDSPHLHEELAESLVRIGFTIKRKKWAVTTFSLDENGEETEDEKEENEYTLIIRPLAFPVKYLLKAIVLVLPS